MPKGARSEIRKAKMQSKEEEKKAEIGNESYAGENETERTIDGWSRPCDFPEKR